MFRKNQAEICVGDLYVNSGDPSKLDTCHFRRGDQSTGYFLLYDPKHRCVPAVKGR